MFRRTLAIAAGAALVLAGALAVQPAVATEIGPQGGPTAECKAAGYDYGIKLDTGSPGTYIYDDVGPWTPNGDDRLPVDVTVTIDDDNSFTWTADPDVAAVLIKAGQGYTILPGGAEGEGTPSSGKGISHITFCYDDEPEGDPEEHLTVSKTVTTSYDRQHHWEVVKSADVHDVYLHTPDDGGATTATVTWDIDVNYLAPPTDSNFMVMGTITVLNDGDGAVAVADVEDTIMVGEIGTDVMVDCGVTFPVNLAEGDDLECTYSHAVGSKIDGDNIATATTVGGTEYESLPMPINWGAPTNETDEKVTLTDLSDLGDTIEPTEFTAPMGGSVTYSHEFTWDDYGQADCGDHVVNNTATLTGETLLLTDTETVNVHVQCYVFQGETAWAANAGPGTLPYNTKKGGNWATYVQFLYPNTAPMEKTYQVYAGQTTDVGEATITPNGDGTVDITIDLDDGWVFADTASNLKVQTYANAPSGNPSPGSFTYKTTCMDDACVLEDVPVANYYGIHLDVGVWVPDPMFP